MESGCCYAAFSEFNQLSRFTRTFPGRKAEGRRTKGRDNSVKWDLNPCDCSCTGAAGEWAEGTVTECCVFECGSFVQAKSNWTVLGFCMLVVISSLWDFLSLLIPDLYVCGQSPAQCRGLTQGMCNQETCMGLNKCHVISAQNTLKVTRITIPNSCAN